MNEIVAWKNYLTDEEQKILITEYEAGHWQLSGHSLLDSQTRFFWFMNLIHSDKIIKIFKPKLENFLEKEINITRAYANGQSHGQCGQFHQDIPGCDLSFVYYFHKNWLPEYGGHLLIKTENNLESYWPESNSGIMFDSRLWHCALEPTTFCNTQRLSLALKFKIL